MKISSKSIKLLLHKILWRFRQIEKWKFSQASCNKKLVVAIPLPIIDFVAIKDFYYCIRKNFVALKAT